jgi:hypothetical protein
MINSLAVQEQNQLPHSLATTNQQAMPQNPIVSSVAWIVIIQWTLATKYCTIKFDLQRMQINEAHRLVVVLA